MGAVIGGSQMLIRSQDKKSLFPIALGYFAVEKWSDGYSVFLNSGYLPDAWWRLGDYSTEDKAIEVLNELQACYDNSMTKQKEFIFIMPQDEEVSV